MAQHWAVFCRVWLNTEALQSRKCRAKCASCYSPWPKGSWSACFLCSKKQSIKFLQNLLGEFTSIQCHKLHRNQSGPGQQTGWSKWIRNHYPPQQHCQQRLCLCHCCGRFQFWRQWNFTFAKWCLCRNQQQCQVSGTEALCIIRELHRAVSR